MSVTNKKVLAFGTFDGLHEGHRFFLSEAMRLGETLVIAVARDESVQKHKGRLPKNSESVRMKAVAKEYPHALVLLGDAEAESWKILRKVKPAVIAIGYDQNKLYDALQMHYEGKKSKPVIAVLPDHFGDKLHSSLLQIREE